METFLAGRFAPALDETNATPRLEYDPSDAEIIMASDALAMKGHLSRPLTGRGHPGVIRWRRSKRDAAQRQKPERKLLNRQYDKAYKARKKIERPDEWRDDRKTERKRYKPKERKRYAKKLKERNQSGLFVAVDAEGCNTGATFYDGHDHYSERRTFLCW